MIQIEKVSNGYIVHVDEDETIVFQREYQSMNMALAAVLNFLKEQWQDDEHVKVKLDVGE